MTENENKQKAGPTRMLKGLLAILGAALLICLGVFGWQSMRNASNGPQEVAMLDSEAIYALPEYVSTKKELEGVSQRLEKQLIETIQQKKLSPEEAEALRLQMRQKLAQEQAKRVKPLNDRVTAAIANIAVQHHLRVVLDKRIVVTGVPDISEEVKKRFETDKNVPMPKATPETLASIGYVNQETIGDLRIYKEANFKLYQYYQELGKKFDKQLSQASPTQREKLRSDMVRLLEDKQVTLLKPVNDKINLTITEVAKEKGLSLVLDSHHVMWGGRNLTDDVIKKLVKG